MIHFFKQRRLVTWLVGAIVIFVVGFAIAVLMPYAPQSKGAPLVGFTFSTGAAEYLQLNPEEVLQQAVRDLQPDVVRLPLYWDRIETEEGEYLWEEIDAQLAVLTQGEARAMLAIGHKLPRWPECHLPHWLDRDQADVAQQALARYLTAAVQRYKDHPVLYAWQIENEALFRFGDCPAWSNNRDFLKQEVELVKALDADTPVFTSDSGELSLWWRTSSLPVDGVSISLYRVVYNRRFIHWPVNPNYYNVRRAIIRVFNKRFIISELQTEPWGSAPVDHISDNEIQQSLPVEALAERFDFAHAIDVEAILAWGVEWWYYRKVIEGDDRYWSEAIRLFHEHGR